MTKCEELYEFYKKHPQAKNPEVAEALHWDPYHVKKYKFRLKSRGLIAVTPDGVETAPPFSDEGHVGQSVYCLSARDPHDFI